MAKKQKSRTVKKVKKKKKKTNDSSGEASAAAVSSSEFLFLFFLFLHYNVRNGWLLVGDVSFVLHTALNDVPVSQYLHTDWTCTQ